MAKTGYDTALEIVRRFDGRLPSKDIKAKIAKQGKISQSSASTYFYLCRSKIAEEKKRTAKKRR